MKVLHCDPDIGFIKSIQGALEAHDISSENVSTGRDCQLRLFKGSFDTLIIDLETKSHSPFEVVKYVRSNHLKIFLVLTINGRERLKDLELTEEEIFRTGVDLIIFKPAAPEGFLQKLLDAAGFSQDQSPDTSPDEIDGFLEEMCALESSDLIFAKVIPIDFYMKAEGQKFIKCARKGDTFLGDKQELFFRASDRPKYLEFMNEILEKQNKTLGSSAHTNLQALKSVCDKYIQEIHVHGLALALVDEGKKICANMYALIERDSKLRDLMRDYKEISPDRYSQNFLVAFFATVTAKNLEWNSPRTTELVALGSFLHDLGFLKLNPDLELKSVEELNPAELVLYRSHPKLGVDYLRDVPSLSEPVYHIVLQHHEYMNGTGFPNKLSGSKIYPLAKIVTLADGFTSLMLEHHLSPLETLKKFIQDRQVIDRYDPILIKALITGFVKEKK